MLEAIPFKKNAASENLGNRAVLEKLSMLVKGIEPPTYALRVRCSTPELHQQIHLKSETKIIIRRFRNIASIST